MYEYTLVKETDKYRTYETFFNEKKQGLSTSKKVPCLGGPVDKQMLTRIDLFIAKLNTEYVEFNRAGWGTKCSTVFVHKDLLPC